MSFFGGGKKQTPQAAPRPAAQVSRVADQPDGDSKRKKRRRGVKTVLTEGQSNLGATAGKSLLGA